MSKITYKAVLETEGKKPGTTKLWIVEVYDNGEIVRRWGLSTNTLNKRTTRGTKDDALGYLTLKVNKGYRVVSAEEDFPSKPKSNPSPKPNRTQNQKRLAEIKWETTNTAPKWTI